jgi:hypothetical protein
MKRLALIRVKLDRRYLLLLCVVVGGSLAFAFLASAARPWPFSDVTAAEAAREGLKITPLSTPSEAQALRAAKTAASFGGQPAEKVVYAHCVDTTKAPRLNQDCWAVSLKPTLMRAFGPALASGAGYCTYGGKCSSTNTTGSATRSSTADSKSWNIVFVDPATGKVIEGTEGQIGG